MDIKKKCKLNVQKISRSLLRDLILRFTKTGTFKSNYWSTQEVFSNRKDIVEMIEVGKRKKAKTTKKYKEIYQKTTEKC